MEKDYGREFTKTWQKNAMFTNNDNITAGGHCVRFDYGLLDLKSNDSIRVGRLLTKQTDT